MKELLYNTEELFRWIDEKEKKEEAVSMSDVFDWYKDKGRVETEKSCLLDCFDAGYSLDQVLKIFQLAPDRIETIYKEYQEAQLTSDQTPYKRHRHDFLGFLMYEYSQWYNEQEETEKKFGIMDAFRSEYAKGKIEAENVCLFSYFKAGYSLEQALKIFWINPDRIKEVYEGYEGYLEGIAEGEKSMLMRYFADGNDLAAALNTLPWYDTNWVEEVYKEYKEYEESKEGGNKELA